MDRIFRCSFFGETKCRQSTQDREEQGFCNRKTCLTDIEFRKSTNAFTILFDLSWRIRCTRWPRDVSFCCVALQPLNLGTVPDTRTSSLQRVQRIKGSVLGWSVGCWWLCWLLRSACFIGRIFFILIRAHLVSGGGETFSTASVNNSFEYILCDYRKRPSDRDIEAFSNDKNTQKT